MGFWKSAKKLIKNPKNLLAVAASPFTAGASLAFLKDNSGNNILGEITGANAAKAANKKNIELQEKTNQQSIELANTAHQREVEDLKAAGLNPVLSAGGQGAATPALGTATVENTMPGGYLAQAGQVANVASMFSSAKQMNAQAKNLNVQTELATPLAKAEIANKMAGAGSAKAQSAYTEAMEEAQRIENKYHTETNTANDTAWQEKAIKSVKNSAKREMNEWKEKAKQNGWTGFKYKARNWLFKQ